MVKHGNGPYLDICQPREIAVLAPPTLPIRWSGEYSMGQGRLRRNGWIDEERVNDGKPDGASQRAGCDGVF